MIFLQIIPVFVFSDDLEWCETFYDDRFLIADEIKYNHTSDTNDGRVQSLYHIMICV